MNTLKAAFITSLSVFALATGSALAADMGLPPKAPLAPPPPPTINWTGCYVDGGAGYGLWNQDNFSENGTVPVTTEQTTGGRGWFGQVGGGCDYQFPVAGWGNFLAGVLADYSFMNIHGQFSDVNTGESGREKESRAWAVGVRLGYLATPNFLTYINGGWTQTRFDQVDLGTFPSGAPPSGTFIPATTYNGWFLGGGTETSLAGWFPSLPRGLFLRSEYRFSTFSSKDVAFGGTAIVGETGVHVTKFVQTISTALVWKFWTP